MRPGPIIMVGGISLFVALTVAFLLFWFAAPRWQPELVMRYSPSLWHAVKALTHYENPKSSSVFSTSTTGTVIFIYKDEEHSLKRFESLYGDKFYATLAATDDGTDPHFSNVIVYYLSDHVHHREARKVLWQYRKKGNVQARDILYGDASRRPQGISPPKQLDQNRR